MKIEPIADELFDELIVQDEKEDKLKALREKYPVPEQVGPLRRFDQEMRCASRRCGSSTFVKVQGVPYCMTHALDKLNEMLHKLGVLK